ncbi:uncharacterized protein CDAR_242421 [Caerostris darwini]|uniref:Ig-like domain-containing protein n=1 Tax=Caerostris darwini TaxID=1538125 RepID=A0AAV4RS00_9ARAC|nr:uncharacterized protein CDAR_242421 [Caerostris darwini]
MIYRRESEVTDALFFPIQVRCQGALKRGSSAQSNRSMCCSFGIHNSSHFHNPCTPAEEGSSSAQHNPHQGPMASQCVLRIPITLRRKRPLVSYDLVSCEGVSVRLVCETSCSDQGVSWRKEGRSLTKEKELRLQDIRREDGGTYFCEVTDYYGRSRLAAQVIVTVQFAPVILVPKTSSAGDSLVCATEASPSARISLVPLASSNHSHNYTCVASNRHGQSTITLLLLTDSPETAPEEEAPEGKRRFNVTGFIVGMLPPLFISFYIIVKLGYRSRYAEERGEDYGFREEPFFISY